MAVTKTLAWCVVAAALLGAGQVPARVRPAGIGDGTITDLLRPDDDVVEIHWPIEEDRAFQLGNLSLEQWQSAVKTQAVIVARVIVKAVSGALARDGKWIHTSFVGTVDEVIVVSPTLPDRDRIAHQQAIEFQTSGGELVMGRATVRTEGLVRYPAGRYLVALGQRGSDGAWPVFNSIPLLIQGERLLALAPLESPLSGMMLADVTYALRTGRRVLLPRDQLEGYPELAEWIRRLRTAAEKGDLAVIRDSCAPTMRVEFEEVSRESALKWYVKEGEPWRALRDALRLGVVREVSNGREYVLAPYTDAGGGPPGYSELVITARGVNVRSAPEPNAPVIGSLTYDVVKEDLSSHNFDSSRFNSEDNPSGKDAWAKIIMPDGVTGYVYGRFVRGPWNMRFVIERVDGKWLITAMAAGD